MRRRTGEAWEEDVGSTNGSMWCMARSWRQRHRLAGGDKVHGIQGRVGGHGAWSGSDTRRTWWHSSNSSPRPTPTNSTHSVLTTAVLSRSTQGHPSLVVSQHSVPVLHTMPSPPSPPPRQSLLSMTSSSLPPPLPKHHPALPLPSQSQQQ